MDAPVVLRQRQPRWALALLGVFVIVALAMVVAVVLLDDPRRLLSFIPTAGFVVVGLVLLVRPPQIELHEDALVARTLRSVRIPYTDITAVRGDVPSRLDWSTHLVVERREAAPVKLAPVEAPLTEVHDLITARAGLD